MRSGILGWPLTSNEVFYLMGKLGVINPKSKWIQTQSSSAKLNHMSQYSRQVFDIALTTAKSPGMDVRAKKNPESE